MGNIFYNFTEPKKIDINKTININRSLLNNLNLDYNEEIYNESDITITEGVASSQVSSENNKKLIEPSNENNVLDNRFSYNRCVPIASKNTIFGGSKYCSKNDNNKAPQRQHNMTISFTHIGSFVAFRFCSWSGEKYRILVDGKVLNDYKFKSIEKQTSEMWCVKLKFSTEKHRLITLELADTQFAGCWIGENDNIFASSIFPNIKCIALGDSVTQGQNTGDSAYSIWCKYLSDYLNWDIMDQGEGGTGWINPGALAEGRTFKGRLDSCVIPYKPDVIIFAGGLNDQTSVNSTYTSDARKRQIKDTLDYTMEKLPNVKIICISPFFTQLSSKGELDVNNDIKEICDELDIDFINLEGLFNADCKTKYISDDLVHPNYLGHQYWAKIIADKISKCYI